MPCDSEDWDVGNDRMFFLKNMIVADLDARKRCQLRR